MTVLPGPRPPLTQAEAGYINAYQAGGAKAWPGPGKGIRCGTCRWFVAPPAGTPLYGATGVGNVTGYCRIVQGRSETMPGIDSQGCCDLWNADGPGIPLESVRPAMAPEAYDKLRAFLRERR